MFQEREIKNMYSSFAKNDSVFLDAEFDFFLDKVRKGWMILKTEG